MIGRMQDRQRNVFATARVSLPYRTLTGRQPSVAQASSGDTPWQLASPSALPTLHPSASTFLQQLEIQNPTTPYNPTTSHIRAVASPPTQKVHHRLSLSTAAEPTHLG